METTTLAYPLEPNWVIVGQLPEWTRMEKHQYGPRPQVRRYFAPTIEAALARFSREYILRIYSWLPRRLYQGGQEVRIVVQEHIETFHERSSIPKFLNNPYGKCFEFKLTDCFIIIGPPLKGEETVEPT
jgi:hypothetical protein